MVMNNNYTKTTEHTLP